MTPDGRLRALRKFARTQAVNCREAFRTGSYAPYDKGYLLGRAHDAELTLREMTRLSRARGREGKTR